MSTDDSRLMVSTRTDWCKWLPAYLTDDEVGAEMITYGVAEFNRYSGAITVIVTVTTDRGQRRMTWAGLSDIDRVQ